MILSKHELLKNYWKSFQQDAAAAVVINDGTLVANPNDYTINLRDQVEYVF